MRVRRRRHNRPVRRAAGMVLDVQTERLAKMSYLQSAGNAHVVFGIGVNQVAAAAKSEGRLGLKSPNVLADQERRIEPLAQPLVPFDCASGVAIGIFVPEEAGLVASSADRQRITPCPQLRSRIEHQRPSVANGFANAEHGRDLAVDIAVVPAVDLEASETALPASDGIVGKSSRRIKAARLLLTVIGAGVNRQLGPESAEEPRDRDIAPFASEVPKRDIERTMAHMVVGANLSAEILPNLLACVGIAPNKMRGEHRGLSE